jgi:hypothetical protein
MPVRETRRETMPRARKNCEPSRCHGIISRNLMTVARLLRAGGFVACVLVVAGTAPGCAAVAAGGAIGPTIDLDGTPGVEVNGNAGLGLIHLGSGDQNTASIDTVLVGIQASVGVEHAHPLVPMSLQAYVEYLRMGAPSSPWGLHARLSTGFGSWNGGSVPISFTVGPQRLFTQTAAISTTAGGQCLGRVAIGDRRAQGFDISIRTLLNRSLFGIRKDCPECHSSFQLGLFYDVQVERFIQAPCALVRPG